ncbi:Single-pass membrane and coiled-coil domain-containing protein 4-like [Homarus americanus]|uniref:Single-pass membrane and coiled-coil domain-containing protein 4 homolog n=1 Tax=Homarus americanus TaxID=6706 RepID=A0A8J5JDA3_HOMAM|nr:Single-pass membrane and coiled-coil domain-containing protein 4-like [Homarus americanus]
MRQLKGKVKETAKEKKERKKEFMENKDKAFTVALPVLGAVFLLIAILVYFKTRPKEIEL